MHIIISMHCNAKVHKPISSSSFQYKSHIEIHIHIQCNNVCSYNHDSNKTSLTDTVLSRNKANIRQNDFNHETSKYHY